MVEWGQYEQQGERMKHENQKCKILYIRDWLNETEWANEQGIASSMARSFSESPK